MLKSPLCLLAVLGIFGVEESFAQDLQSPTNSDWQTFNATITQTHIVPLYKHFHESAGLFTGALTRLCEAPSTEGLSHARQTFAHVVDDFGAASVLRFGPIRADTRLERLMHWPDPRGRSLRQIQKIIATEDPTALQIDTLRQKSVAVQGLIAQDYLLFGTGAEDLSKAAPYRCQYALTSAHLIEDIAANTQEDWEAYANTMASAGPDNAVFKSPAEVGQRLIGSLRESLQLLSDQHLKAVLKDSPDAAKPKLSAFWRSNQTVAFFEAVVSSVDTLTQAPAWQALSSHGTDKALGLVQTELAFAQRVFTNLETDQGWRSLVQNAQGHGALRAATFNLDGAKTHLETSLLGALGLNAGFNSLDGD